MAIATATALEVFVGGRPLFSDVSFRLEAGQRMTLAGRNGAGKTTLLRVLAGELVPESGRVALGKGTRVALHDQRPPRGSGATLGEYVLSARAEAMETEAELGRLEAAMQGAGSDPELLSAYAAAQQRLELAGGYRWREEVLAVLGGLGFGEADSERPLSSFSGGELTRASLARALAGGPDLLLLDEPTNHLDVATLEWLEDYLCGLQAAIVLVAHDRWFLESVGTSVLELEAGRGRFFAGPWHAWRTEQAARELALGRTIERQQAEIARMERFVERFRYKATKARQAQSKLKRIERIRRDAAAPDPRDRRDLRFSFATPERPGRMVAELKEARIEVPGRTLLNEASMHLERGEHVVLVGPNGSGKTTLLETIAGHRPPASGSVRLGHNVKLGYLSQHAETAAGRGTVLEAAQRQTGLSGQKARDLLGAFLFSGPETEKPLAEISGGEQRRLSLAILVASGANLLVLDEPTNHLDLESREALEDALTSFEGTVLLVSHDRALLEAVGTRTLACEEGALRDFPGPWAEYVRDREERQAARREPPATGGRRRRERRAGPSKNALRRLAELEKRIEEAEAGLRRLEDELADPALWSSPGRSERATERHHRAKREVERLYEEWQQAEAATEGTDP
jgi:ATP-binding cassette subfamily F protein 3